ncbi:MAG: TIGR01244 family phosphatase [Hyphomonadaceae bacterium]|nr:TIGR01244 family phosphatase [Hyphomonadaceae bacterium]MCA8886723.1 TIGR01244 family phosphatase [Hyphomonadaceae bacterium]
MSNFKRVTPDFAVSVQLGIEDVARAAAEGFKTIIANRPDNEAPDQPSAAEIKAAAEAAGLDFRSIPFSGLPPAPTVVMETAQALDEAKSPVLAYCRSGTRSITAWALARALAGSHTPDEIIALAQKAGYDLSGARGALETLAPKA